MKSSFDGPNVSTNQTGNLAQGETFILKKNQCLSLQGR
jgi:hypothetical protein